MAEELGGLGKNATFPAYAYAPITPGPGPLTDPDGGEVYTARALWCETAGLATVVSLSGKTRTGIPLVAGMNPVAVVSVTAFSGTNLWGVKA